MFKSKKAHILLIAAVMLISCPCISRAAAVWVDGASDNLYYYDDQWHLAGGHEILAATSTGPYGRVGFAEFDLTTIPSGQIYDFTLHLKDTGGAAGNSTTEISYYVGDGSIAASDINVVISGVFGSVTRPYQGQPTDLNVTDIVRAFLTSGYAYIGFKFSPQTGSDAFGFVDYWTLPERRSGLLYEETAVPIPAAAWLLGSGLLGLIALRRKRTK